MIKAKDVDAAELDADWPKHVDGGKHRKAELRIHRELDKMYRREEKRMHRNLSRRNRMKGSE